jgi:uncharacterized protein (TIRG00374 family)
MQTSSRKFLVVAAVLLALGYAIYRFGGMIEGANFSGTKLLHSLKEANPILLLLSLIVIYGCYAVRSLRWQLFQGNLGNSRFGVIYGMTLAGFAAIFLFGRAGEPVRPLLLARKERLPIADMTGIYALERIFDIVSAVVVAGIALLIEKRHVPIAATSGAFLIAGVLGAIAFLAYFRFTGIARLEGRFAPWLASAGWRKKSAEVLLGFARGVQMIRSWGELALVMIYSAVHWFMVLLVYIWVSHSFGGKFLEINTGDAMLLMAFTLAGSVFQLPLAGGGSQLAAISVYKFFGMETEAATAAAVVLWLITFAACSFAGVPILVHEGMSFGKLREFAHEKEATGEDAQYKQGDPAS